MFKKTHVTTAHACTHLQHVCIIYQESSGEFRSHILPFSDILTAYCLIYRPFVSQEVNQVTL